MGLGRVLVGFRCVLMSFLVVALDVVLSCQVMVLGCFFVVLCGLVVCFVCHFDFPVGNLPARSYLSDGEIVAAFGRRFTKFAGNSRAWKLAGARDKKMPPISWEVIFPANYWRLI
jgi:hypothetical protein